MSLLLDALKKSEAQRRRGDIPTIDLAQTLSKPRGRGFGLRWIIGLLGIVVLVAAAPWMWSELAPLIERRQASDPDLDEPARQAVAARDRQSAADIDDAGTPRSPGSTRQSEQQQDPESLRVTEPRAVAGAAAERRVDRPATADREVTAGNAGPVEAGPSVGPPDGAADRKEIRQARDQGRDQGAVEQDSPAVEARRPAPDPASGLARAREPVEEPVGEPAQERESLREREPDPEPEPERENFIRAWELPQSQRSEFPELELTVHYYARRPVDRFVLINGERYGEGQLVEPGVRVAEIRKSGAVIEFGDYRVLVE